MKWPVMPFSNNISTCYMYRYVLLKHASLWMKINRAVCLSVRFWVCLCMCGWEWQMYYCSSGLSARQQQQQIMWKEECLEILMKDKWSHRPSRTTHDNVTHTLMYIINVLEYISATFSLYATHTHTYKCHVCLLPLFPCLHCGNYFAFSLPFQWRTLNNIKFHSL